MSDLEVQNLTKSCHEMLILAALARGERHGYQLAIEIEERSRSFFRLTHGTLYPILHKLEKEKLIRGIWKAEGLRRKRRCYRLTARGERVSRARLGDWETFFTRFFDIAGDLKS